ncbi:tetratricopeptide repeat protein [Sphaerisporangium sp. B11E5]|uniref:ATP-binding protein n=1 Tax=Sphaerisporangium sp. B11E5 TaxID=3153563 RepID=UPI00325D1C12
MSELDGTLRAVRNAADAGTSAVAVCAIAGPPGVGKTALAVHWAHRVRAQFPDGELYVDMQGYGPGIAITPEYALDHFLRALDISPDNIPADLEGRASLFRSILDARRILVIIDNVASSQQVRRLLPATRQCFAVVTSRSTLPGVVVREGAVRVILDVLSPEESVRLLSELIGRERIEAEPDAARDIAGLCGYLPLALRITAERAASRPRLSLHEIAEEVAAEQNRLDALATDEDELSDVRAVFSWSYSALSPELRRTYRLLSLHAGSEMGTEAVAALTGSDVRTTRRRLRALVDVHLLQEVSAYRFYLHDLLRAYATERTAAEETLHERTLALRRMLSWYLHAAEAGRKVLLPYSPTIPMVPAAEIELPEGLSGGPVAMRWFVAERGNIMAALNTAMDHGQYDIAWKLAVVTTGFFELNSNWSEGKESHRIGLAAALALGDAFGEACNRVMLGDAERRLGRLGDAAESYRKAADLGRELAVGWLEGFALRGLGLVMESRGQHPGAHELFLAALRVFREAGVRRGEGMALLSLGRSARALGEPGDAVGFGRQAIAIFEEIGDRWTVAWGRLALADGLRESGDQRDSLPQLREAARVFREFGDERSEAMALAPLGELLERSGDITGAREAWTRALTLYRSVNDERATDLAGRLATLEDGPLP